MGLLLDFGRLRSRAGGWSASARAVWRCVGCAARTFFAFFLSGSAASKSGLRGGFAFLVASRCLRFFRAAVVCDSLGTAGRPACARADAVANFSFFSRAAEAQSAASCAARAAAAVSFSAVLFAFRNPKDKRDAICLYPPAGAGDGGGGVSAERQGHRARGGEGPEEGEGDRVRASANGTLKARVESGHQPEQAPCTPEDNMASCVRSDGHQAGLADQLAAGGLEGAERARHAACDVLCSVRLARVRGERTYDATARRPVKGSLTEVSSQSCYQRCPS